MPGGADVALSGAEVAAGDGPLSLSVGRALVSAVSAGFFSVGRSASSVLDGGGAFASGFCGAVEAEEADPLWPLGAGASSEPLEGARFNTGLPGSSSITAGFTCFAAFACCASF